MGSPILDLLVSKQVSLDELKGKVLAVDAFNMLYQFLTTIRARDGSLLRDSRGNVTSHLIGLFSRTVALLQKGLRLVFVFDGEPPELKRVELDRRRALKESALESFERAKSEEDVEGMFKFASRTARLTGVMVEDSKRLLSALGVPFVQAPSEGEAQAAFMVRKGVAFAVASQDADAFLFGASRVVRNVSVVGRRKKVGKLVYQSVQPELFSLSDSLNSLGISFRQFVVVGVLAGTDFAVGGVKGVGPKKALQLVKRFGEDFEALFEYVRWFDFQEVDWRDVLRVFEEVPVVEDFDLRWSSVDRGAVLDLLVGEHDFSRERVERSLDALVSVDNSQQSLSDFF